MNKRIICNQKRRREEEKKMEGKARGRRKMKRTNGMREITEEEELKKNENEDEEKGKGRNDIMIYELNEEVLCTCFSLFRVRSK